MLRQLFLFPIILLIFTACNNPDVGSSSTSQMQEGGIREDIQAVNKAVEAIYEAYSFRDGKVPATEDILQHFTSEAILSYMSGDSLVVKPAPEYFEQWRRNNREQGIEVLQEQELAGRTEIFGPVAHRISSVKFDVIGKESSTGYGVISLQLVRQKGRWLVHSMLWHTADEDESLPERFRVKE